ncbi:MAG: contractile injection system protein, VgrG/Pvc8 family, partial [Fibromonadales bacterium]|nr:contractile injection system protein, VgrG/Pvc8 family [Fibromonadales bacterium]
MIADTSLFNISVDGLSGKLTVLSFTLEEGIYGDDLLTVSLLSRNKLPDSLADKDVSFSFEYEGKKEFFYGPVTNCTAEQTATGASAATIKAKTIRHLLDKEKKCAVYCKSDVEDIANSILGKAKISNAKLSLSKYYETAFKVQYNESDLAFLQRIFEEHNIIEFVQHSGNGSELVVSDGNDFAVSGSTFIKCCLEGTEAGNIFHGYSHNALRPGQAFDAFDETFIVCSASHTGSQAAAFGIKGEADGYTCQVTAFSKRMLGSLPCRKNKPQVPGVIVAKVEGYKDAP